MFDKKEYQRQYRLANKEKASLYHKEYRLKNKEKILAYKKKWVIDNPDKVKERYRLNKEKPIDTLRVRNYMLKVRYDLTLEGYDSLLQKQNYRCAICERDKIGRAHV